MEESDVFKAFESRDAKAVAALALRAIGDKVECVTFLGQVMGQVGLAADSREALPDENKSAKKDNEPKNKRKLKDETHSPKPKRTDQKNRGNTDRGFDFFEPDIQDNRGSLYILIPNALMGAVIGKAGATVKHLTWETGAKIEMERYSDGNNRLVSLIGTLRQITVACHEVVELADLDAIPLLVPNSICGLIIGKQGCNIKKLESETGAKLQIEHEGEHDVRKVMVGGEPSMRSHALYLIASLISANESRLGVFDPRGGNGPRGQNSAGQGPSRQVDDDAQPIYRAPSVQSGPMPSLNQQQILLQQMQQLQQLQSQLGVGGMQGSMGGGMPGMGGG
eukprot:CAMPEP_0118956106 /NCGR_PEP_ID=MMETSP1169-20130426/61109_1 /TAXON_ID=36882 /ORGANISM="Pyramimonas obovata, Strain CCMP722" /LENGTH=335 /DNA_ID=CAMNT_0006904075 /DNA_START=3 /DNA_END=1006 /DNA_ORIENTATION=+